ncbi:MAG: hypothetical protein O3B16_04020 [Chloroflexi bacterium]|nr:hypothetical protein [Chloroflexota bacterium]
MEGIGSRQGGMSAQALQRTRVPHFYADFAGCGSAPLFTLAG